MFEPDAFDAFEACGWEDRAAGYDRFFGPITARLADPLLDGAGVGRETRTLDVATGPGYVAARAAERGAAVVGVDVAQAMVALARELHPGLDVRRADVNALPFADASFDAVVAGFLLPHLGRPDVAVGELARVLAPGGRLALTTWDRPAAARFVGVFVDGVTEAGARPPADVPAGPDFFRFSDDDELDALLARHGLGERTVRTIAFPLRVSSAAELWEGLLGGAVRLSALILGQPEDVRRRIREGYERALASHRHGDGFELAVSVKLGAGRRPQQAGRSTR